MRGVVTGPYIHRNITPRTQIHMKNNSWYVDAIMWERVRLVNRKKSALLLCCADVKTRQQIFFSNANPFITCFRIGIFSVSFRNCFHQIFLIKFETDHGKALLCFSLLVSGLFLRSRTLHAKHSKWSISYYRKLVHFVRGCLHGI